MLTLLLIITTWRLTRLLVRDEFPPTRALREWVLRTMADIQPDGTLTPSTRWGHLGHTFAYLWTCTWCMSVWVGAGLLVATYAAGVSVRWPWLVWAACSAGSGLLNMLDMEHDQRWRLREAQITRIEQQR